MRCQEIQDRLEKLVDHELSAHETIELEAHLSHCDECSQTFENLKAIDAIGKMEIFLKPQPEYWRALHQNIIAKIGKEISLSKKIITILESIKENILSVKLSYRLAGLAATAVMLFFIIHLAFFRNGKFELPVTIDERDAVKITEQKGFQLETEQEINLKDKLSYEEVQSKGTRIPETVEDQEKSIFSAESAQFKPEVKIVVPERRQLNEIIARSDQPINMKSTEKTTAEEAPASVFQESIKSKKMTKRIGIEPTVATYESNKYQQENLKVMTVVNKSSEQEIETSLNEYYRILQQAQKTDSIAAKIKLWEDYLKTNPTIELSKKAKYEQALLYYQLATEKKTKEKIMQAMAYYLENAKFLFSGADSIIIEQQFMELKALFKKIKTGN